MGKPTEEEPKPKYNVTLPQGLFRPLMYLPKCFVDYYRKAYRCRQCDELLQNPGSILCELCQPATCWVCIEEFTEENEESPFLVGVHSTCESKVEIEFP